MHKYIILFILANFQLNFSFEKKTNLIRKKFPLFNQIFEIMTKKRILITNDDGIQAPGIKHLWNSLKNDYEVTVVAPHQEQSGVGVSVTIRHPLQLNRLQWNGIQAYSVTGTPADCVKLALNVILDERPHLIVSGINRGTNSGRNVLYSGTCGGVIEGTMRDIPGIAFSLSDYQDPKFESIERFIPPFLEFVFNKPLPPQTFLNVNFPSVVEGAPKGFKFARQGKEYWGESLDARNHPTEGHTYYWIGARKVQFEENEESDVSWLNKGYVAAVPVNVGDLTENNHLRTHKDLFEKHFECLNF